MRIAHNDFHVAPSPGRKKEIINGDTLRNAFRTIKKAKPDHFKFTTKNQRIIIEMPFLRELHQQFFDKKLEVAAVNISDLNTSETLSTIDKTINLDAMFLGEDVPDDAAATSRIEDINKNKQTTTQKNIFESAGQKAPISDQFVPNARTIAEALARGYQAATNPAEIQAFIDHNKATASQWADYNPIYLRWLARGEERIQQQTTKTHSGRMNHAGSNNRQAPKPSPRERVKQAYSRQFDFNETTGCFTRRPNAANGYDSNLVASAY